MELGCEPGVPTGWAEHRPEADPELRITPASALGASQTQGFTRSSLNTPHCMMLGPNRSQVHAHWLTAVAPPAALATHLAVFLCERWELLVTHTCIRLRQTHRVWF